MRADSGNTSRCRWIVARLTKKAELDFYHHIRRWSKIPDWYFSPVSQKQSNFLIQQVSKNQLYFFDTTSTTEPAQFGIARKIPWTFFFLDGLIARSPISQSVS